MPEPKSFEHSRRAVRWLLATFLFILGGGAIARQALSYAEANGITNSGESALVDGLLWTATAVTILAIVPVYFTFRALFDARRDYDEGYIRIWSAVTSEDTRKALGLTPGRTDSRIFAPAVEPRTYSEAVYGKKERGR